MNKKKLYVISTILVLFSVYTFLSNWNLTINDKIRANQYKIVKNQNEILLNQIQIINQKIDTFSIFSSDSLNTKLNSYLMDNKVFTLLVDDNACKDCVSKELNNIRMLSEKIGADKIIFITHYPRMKDAKIWKNYWNIEFPVYNSLYSLVLSPKNCIKPISMFVLDSTMIPQHIFMPIDTLPELTNQYYAFVKSLFSPIDSVKSLPKSRVSFDKVKYNCGNLKKKEIQTIQFVLKNEGKYPIVINKIETTCGCTVPAWDKVPVSPGGTREISVTYNAEKPGFFQQKIFVFSNAENSPHGLIISGKVID